MKRQALVVGINRYPFWREFPTSKDGNLKLSNSDAEAVARLLELYGDFQVKRLPSKENILQIDPIGCIPTEQLKQEITDLFNPQENIPNTALLYFAGRGLLQEYEDGNIESFLATSDTNKRDKYGVSLQWLRELLLKSPVQQQIVWLDCGYSGELLNFGENDIVNRNCDRFLITATRNYEPVYAEINKSGVLTQAILTSLNPIYQDHGKVTSWSMRDMIKAKIAKEKTHQTPGFYLTESPIIITGIKGTQWDNKYPDQKHIDYFHGENILEITEYCSIQNRQEILNDLLSSLSKTQPKIPEYDKLYSFLGSPKPIIYILDDYNDYISKQDGIFQVLASSINNFGKYYRYEQTSARDKFIKTLSRLCDFLNKLSLSFTVKTYPLNLCFQEHYPNIEQIRPTYNLIYQALNLNSYLDRILNDNSDQIAAFIIDLEWLPNLTDEQTQQQTDEQWWQEWKNIGVKAIHILSERYPEIPCLIFTDVQLVNETRTENSVNLEYLNFINLEKHLAKAVNRLYGCYQEVPFQQFNVNQTSPLWQTLINKLKLKLPLDKCKRGKAFTKLISGLFPTAQQVELIKILSGGKSQAQANFLVSPISRNHRLATRFIKIGAWFLIQKEYLAYQKVIQPRLNSYTANIIQRPILTEVDQNQMPWGALMYTLAGFPEDYQNLQSLNEVFTNYKDSDDGANFLVKCVRDTLEKVLFPLYQSSISKLPKKQPLWCWLGDVLPCFYTGILIPLIKIPGIEYLDENTKKSDVLIVPNMIINDIKNEELWQAGFSNLQELNTKLDTQNQYYQTNNLPDISPHNSEIFSQPYQKVLLSGWKLISVDVPDNEDEGNIILVHPILGIRVYLCGCSEDIKLRFGATWIRLGMQVNVLVYLDNKAQRLNNIYENLSGFDEFDNHDYSEVDLKIIRNFQYANKISPLCLPSPLNVFGEGFCHPDNYISILGYAAPIHGDLNLNNILYAANETVGWLIDFERVKEQGLVAYDLAKLEGEIWINHLLPYIKELATLSPEQVVDNCYKLLYCCLQSSEFSGDEAEFFRTKVKSDQKFAVISDALLNQITNLLKVIKSIRNFGFLKCQLTRQELQWALSAYFFNAARLHFSPRQDKKHNYITVLAFLVSAWHLIDIVPKYEINIISK
ncbi:hypothetical protein WJM97_10320 [Okeanomitos corallinicola TIOX110]|uniref:Ternary complex associated domain-containing protein n=1 Tax=Okeanomitos corallinicola TIOX110 TaxID=3133117 RepID=A0ABZ2UXB5_9CYAN